MRSSNVAISTLVPLILGIASFIIVTGGEIVFPGNIGWLQEGDPASYYLSWVFYRDSPWQLPLGANPNYGMEISSSIFYSDTLPLFAIFFKLFDTWLPDTFQYFGIWILVCFVLQAFFAWKLVGLLTSNIIIKILSATMFLFVPAFLFRLHGHFTLVGHWSILAALFLCLTQDQSRKTLIWSALALTVALVHSYLFAMVIILWVADVARRVFYTTPDRKKMILEVLLVISLSLLALWQGGYFLLENRSIELENGSFLSGSDIQFGSYGMNVFAMLDSNGWSNIVQDLPEHLSNLEGFNYLGLGILVGIILILPILISHKTQIRTDLKPLLLMMSGLTFLAVTNNIGIGSRQIAIYLPDQLLFLPNLLRASGRMFWPVAYLLLYGIFWILINHYKARSVTFILATILVLQIADTSAGWLVIRQKLSSSTNDHWQTPLQSKFWAYASECYENIRIVSPANQKTDWQVFAYYAAKNHMATNAVYLARIDENKLIESRHQFASEFFASQFRKDSLYILDRNYAQLVSFTNQSSENRIVNVDGYYVLVPNITACTDDQSLESFESVQFSTLPFDQTILVSQFGNGSDYLLTGWSKPEPWGTWSNGNNASMFLPLEYDAGKVTFSFHIDAFLHPDTNKQQLDISINNQHVESLIFDHQSNNNWHEVEIPYNRQKDGSINRLIEIHFQIEDPVNQKNLKMNGDARDLGIGLKAFRLNISKSGADVAKGFVFSNEYTSLGTSNEIL